MEIQDSDERRIVSDTDQFAERYLQRRAIDTNEPQTCCIEDIGYTDGLCIAVRVRIEEVSFFIKLGRHKFGSTSLVYEFFSSLPIYNHKFTEDQLVGTEFDVWLKDDLTGLGFEKGFYDFEMVLAENESLEGSLDDVLDDIRLWDSYRRSDPLNSRRGGWRHEITTVGGTDDDDTFTLSVVPCENIQLSWELELPFQSDLSSNPVARLIEEQGCGDPRYLKDTGEVVVLHRSDIDRRIDTLGFDSTGEWALVTPSEYASWARSSLSQSQSSKEDYLFLSLFFAIYTMVNILSIITFAILGPPLYFLLTVGELSLAINPPVVMSVVMILAVVPLALFCVWRIRQFEQY